ncbi:MAG: neutral zinc metallopeptidase [Desulfovibrio sp.]|nr:neutral zinc metallopeptidase [Desulfovibrio sp.]
MRWQDMERSQNVEDRRGQSFGRIAGGGGRPGILLLLVVLVGGYFGVDLTGLLDSGGTPQVVAPPAVQQRQQTADPSDTLAEFTKVVLKQTENYWSSFFSANGEHYQAPRLVLYTGQTNTACGYGQSAMGPFYCPADRKLYVDLSFYHDMQTQLGGGGDFALGYVVAHEVGHHVQNLLGIAQEVHQMQAKVSKRDANRLSVMMELQADCFAGVWGSSVRRQGRLEQGDLQEALQTATAIGDDRLQRRAQGRVVPDSFTHGTSEERYFWFKRGFDTGNPGMCNTFSEKR